jgi:hypothetical protein
MAYRGVVVHTTGPVGRVRLVLGAVCTNEWADPYIRLLGHTLAACNAGSVALAACRNGSDTGREKNGREKSEGDHSWE